jgi:predicted O-linked N-acetylglucosamine transferase (SPINDLY family)
VAYPAQPSADALSQRLRAGVAGWHCLAGLSDGEAARRIRDDGIHVLLDLSGHTARNRLAVFAWRPAPVQASWLGYFATTGVEQMDYVLADTTGVPPGMHGQFTERIWYLPDTRLCFTPPHTDLPVAPLPALHRGQVTFGCFQALAKVNDDVLSLWSRVLSECSGSRLRLQAASLADERTARALLERLRDHGIDPARVELAGAMSRDDYLAAHAEVDLLLDTFPYPGGTTTCEALWMGVPTVTLAGGSMLARQGASLLCAAGLADWVAQTPDEYVALACAKAGDTGHLARTRAGLRRHVAASPLLDAARFSRHLEDALWGMWRARDGGAEVVAPTG